jgi:hypothetical protein
VSRGRNYRRRPTLRQRISHVLSTILGYASAWAIVMLIAFEALEFLQQIAVHLRP